MALFHTAIMVDDDPIINCLNKAILKDKDLSIKYFMFTHHYNALPFVEHYCFAQSIGSFLPDLLLLDIKMPVMNGFEFLERLLALPGAENLNGRIFLLTSSTAQRDIERAKQYSLAGYLEKPLSDTNIQQI